MTNFVTNTGSGGPTFASDTISAVEYPLAKMAWGAAGAVNQASLTSPIPAQVQPVAAPAATTGAITTSSTVVGPVTMGIYDGLTVTVSGTYAGVNFGFFGSNDNTLWVPVQGVRVDTGIAETTTGVLTANQTRAWDISIGKFLFFRCVASAFTSGSAAVAIQPGMFANESAVAATCQGPAAAGTAIAGNPVLMGGSDATNVRALLMDTTGRALVTLSTATAAMTTKAASTAAAFTDTSIVVENRPGGAQLTASAALADALANPTLGQQAVLNSVFNGTTWDRQRGMGLATTTGDTGAKTATGNGATQTNVGNKGISIVIVLGTVSGTTPTCVFKLQSSTDGGTNWVDIPGAATASLTATGVFGIDVYPGAAVTAGTTTTGTKAVASQVLPRTWRVVWTIGGTTPSFAITSITFNYIPN